MMNRTIRKSIVLTLTAVLLASVLSGCGFSLAPSAPTSVTLDAQKDHNIVEGIRLHVSLPKMMQGSLHRPVYWAVENGIAEGGTGEKTGEFGTEDLVTRAEAVDFIWKMFRKPSVDPEDLTEFTDVPETSPFYDAVQWAASQGVAIGYADEKGKPSGSFGPGDICSRGEFLTILWRFSKPRPVDPENLPSFSDVRESDYFYEAVMAAVQFGIADGETDANGEPLGTFGPSEYCTKAQAMEYLYRFMRPAESEG